MRKLAIGILIAMAVAFLLSSSKLPFKSLAATSNQTNVTVEISAVTKITVAPTNLTWYNVQPNSTGELKYLDIKNSGSNNITSVYAYVDTIDTETTNPIPTGDPTKYASTGLLLMNASTVNNEFYYVGRLDWNITPVGNGTKVDGPPGSYGQANSWGYFRRFDGDYLWNISLGSGIVINDTHGCNSTGTVFMIEDEADDGRPLTRQPTRSGGTVTSIADWGIFGITGGILDGHCIAVHRTCEKIFIYNYDKRSGFKDCTNADFVRDATLTPGNQFTVYTTIWVPYGIPAGWLKSGWLTLEAWG